MDLLGRRNSSWRNTCTILDDLAPSPLVYDPDPDAVCLIARHMHELMHDDSRSTNTGIQHGMFSSTYASKRMVPRSGMRRLHR